MPNIRLPTLAEINAFVAVADHRSFAKAATQLNVTASSVSIIIRSLEETLGVRLFNRTTRSVALTESGERLLANVRPVLDGYATAIEKTVSSRDKPVGNLRIVTVKTGVDFILAPKLAAFLKEYPDITVELSGDAGQTDIVADRFDAGITVTRAIPRDAASTRITGKIKHIAAAAPAYFAANPPPHVPADLKRHQCIRFRGAEGIRNTWAFEKNGKRVTVAIDGPLATDAPALMIRMALDGIGIVHMPRQYLSPLIDQGLLVSVLEDWTQNAAFYLYYPSRQQMPPHLKAFVDFLKKSAGRNDDD